MELQIKDLNKKRVGDLSRDGRTYTCKKGNCITIITANPDGTLDIKFEIIPAA
ncbi:hypothetical protein [Clostridium saccharoperbutylacetonicum]|uniref:hypothetical protein n=1 Tax=Clostridium saccharoperbutylacetonicum TaxID=36745 RepID=UPI0039E7D269